MSSPRLQHFFPSVVIAAVFAVAACGSTPASGGETANPPSTPETNNGEAPSVAYIDARYHYRIDAPGHMSANADGTASVVGPSERLVVSVVKGANAADPAALARSDAASMPASTASFRLMSGPGEMTLNARKVEKFVFSYSAGTSAVTGKAVDLVGVRYYIPKDSTTLAVVTYGIVTNQYDPQGADDIATTFQWQ